MTALENSLENGKMVPITEEFLASLSSETNGVKNEDYSRPLVPDSVFDSFNFGFDEPALEKTRIKTNPRRLNEIVENAYRQITDSSKEGKKLYFGPNDLKKYQKSPDEDYTFSVNFNSVYGENTERDFSQKSVNTLLKDIKERAKVNNLKSEVQMGITIDVSQKVSDDEDVGFIFEVYNPQDKFELMRVDENGKKYVHKGKRELKMRREVRYGGQDYHNAYVFRGKASDFKKFKVLFGSKIKGAYMIKPKAKHPQRLN